jgi:hypothetical protein
MSSLHEALNCILDLLFFTVFNVFVRIARLLNWEQPKEIKIAFMKKLGADGAQRMLASIWCRIFCLPICYPKI